MILGSAVAHESELGVMGRRDVKFRKLAELAVRRALDDAIIPPKPDNRSEYRNIGIVFVTRTGERFAEMYSKVERVKATDFGGAILNSGAGHCAIVFGLRGPQILCVEGDPFLIAKLQIEVGRATHMVVAMLEGETVALAFVV